MMITLESKKIAALERELKAAQAHESKDLLDLAKLVADMRHAQRKYGQTLNWNIREEAIRKAAEVDKAIEAILNDQQRPLLG